MTASELVKTGIEGFDHVLGGGFPPNRLYLIQGDPGVGKTTLSLQFLLEGRAAGESTLYVTLSETKEELRAVAAAHGWSLDNVEIHEMTGGDELTAADEENTLYTPAEVELGERMRALIEVIDRVKPRRVILDSVSELRLLAQTPLRFRRQILALKRGLVSRRCTMLLLENPTVPGGDVLLQSLVHGVVQLDQLSPVYGAERRRLRVIKLRELQFRGGYHDIAITTGGVLVFPRLVAAEHASDFTRDQAASGVPELDGLLGGGLTRGTCSLFLGPAGSGKSALTTRYAVEAARRGEQVEMLIFDEGRGTLLQRSAALGMDLRGEVERGHIRIRQIDPAELSLGELTHYIRDAVERRNARMVIIDSVNGYMNAMAEEKQVVVHLHELLMYLRQKGVVSILVMAQHGMLGSSMMTPIDVSYLADSVILLRFFEATGRLHKAVSVVKHRSGRHEATIRAFSMGAGGFTVGPPLVEFHGILTGVPEIVATAPSQGSQGSQEAQDSKE